MRMPTSRVRRTIAIDVNPSTPTQTMASAAVANDPNSQDCSRRRRIESSSRSSSVADRPTRASGSVRWIVWVARFSISPTCPEVRTRIDRKSDLEHRA
jgi:hypothetical protein